MKINVPSIHHHIAEFIGYRLHEIRFYLFSILFGRSMVLLNLMPLLKNDSTMMHLTIASTDCEHKKKKNRKRKSEMK